MRKLTKSITANYRLSIDLYPGLKIVEWILLTKTFAEFN